MSATKTKYCSRCKQNKLSFEFYKNRQRQDGLQTYCILCCREYNQVTHRKNYIKNYNKTYFLNRYYKTKNGKKCYQQSAQKYRQTNKGKECMARYRAKHYYKITARRAVQYLVERGQMPPASSLICHYCQKKAEQYHHYKGYMGENQLMVVPACARCDRKFH